AILGLCAHASRQDVKAAFRRLAKQHHPDHFARDANAMRQAEKKMKAINQAYHLLTSLLPPAAKKPAHPCDRPAESAPRFFTDIVNRLKKGLFKGKGTARASASGGSAWTRTGSSMSGSSRTGSTTSGSTTSGSTTSGSRTSGSGMSGSGRTHVRCSAKKNRPAGPGKGFEQVFRPLFSGAVSHAAPVGKPGSRQRSRNLVRPPYEGFARYMELQKRIKVQTRFQDQHNCSRVEKISRIRPVGRLQRD
ncbi:MAG: J domain-containing protein, partial [Desulfobacteraceae bacterium]|nr:J domain-containing protein [Desulfobacteraceae bacterium]